MTLEERFKQQIDKVHSIIKVHGLKEGNINDGGYVLGVYNRKDRYYMSVRFYEKGRTKLVKKLYSIGFSKWDWYKPLTETKQTGFHMIIVLGMELK